MPATTASAKTSKPKKARPKTPKVSSDQRLQMIQESAYFRAEQRNFQDGDPVTDWLLSEKEIDDLLTKGTH